jgi:hypothetical protein
MEPRGVTDIEEHASSGQLEQSNMGAMFDLSPTGLQV